MGSDRAFMGRLPSCEPGSELVLLDHGHDDDRAAEALTIDDLRSAAEFRGGRCEAGEAGDPYEPVEWTCALGHRFTMSPNLYLKGGHWCPHCMTDTASYASQRDRNPFFAQVADETASGD